MKSKSESRRTIWKNAKGVVRPLWLLLGGGIAYMAMLCVVVGGLGWLFGRLFEAWGLTTSNLAYAPKWAQHVVAWHKDFAYAVFYGLSAAILLAAGKRLNGKAASRKSLPGAFGVLAGLGTGALLTIVVLLADSMRLEWPLTELVLYPGQLASFAVLSLGWIDVEILSKRFVFDGAKKRYGRWSAYVLACFVGMLRMGGLNSVMGILNALLMALLGCMLYEHGGLRASVGFGIARNAWCLLLFRFPGISVTAQPVYELYHVSDCWLTGGNNGPMAGLGMTLICTALLIWLCRSDMITIATKAMNRRNSHGKDSHCNRRSGFER